MRIALAALLMLGGTAWAAPVGASGEHVPAQDATGDMADGVAPGATISPPTQSGESARSPLVAGLLSFALPVAAVSVLPVIDPYEFEARGATKTAWHVVGWSAIGLFAAAPTLGAMYAGDPWNNGTKVRLASAALFTLGTVLVVTEPNPSSASFRLTPREATGTIIGAVGALGYLTGWVMEGVHSIQVAGRSERPRTIVSAGALQGRSELVPALILGGAW